MSSRGAMRLEPDLELADDSRAYARGMEYLVGVVQQLSLARNLDGVVEIVRHAARELTGADGATFVLREGDCCHYVDEDAIEPLWRGKRFPMTSCISGWSMLHARSVAIEDIYADDRIPADAYRPTFVRSLVMVPIRAEQPLGAIGNYWASQHRARAHEIKLLESLAHSTAVALENASLVESLRTALADVTSARDQLQRQLDLRDEFIAAAAHELRTPVTTMQLQTAKLGKWIAEDEFSGHPRQTALERCFTVTQRQLLDLERLGEDMLDASRIRLGRFSLQREAGIDLVEVVRAAVAEVRTNPSTPVQVEATADVQGTWDRDRVQQMVRNLIDNAVKFGNGHPVQVTATAVDGHARVSVRDQGIGIDPREHDRIFQRFERAAPVTSFRGPGLGLYIARHIAEAHGGALTVDSALEHGATFVAELPLE
jgi:signal transduction histidine kinase